jgi:hypothetical protein
MAGLARTASLMRGAGTRSATDHPDIQRLFADKVHTDALRSGSQCTNLP